MEKIYNISENYEHENFDAQVTKFMTEIKNMVDFSCRYNLSRETLDIYEKLRELVEDTCDKLKSISTQAELDRISLGFEQSVERLYSYLLHIFREKNPTIETLKTIKPSVIFFNTMYEKICSTIEEYYKRLLESKIPKDLPEELKDTIDEITKETLSITNDANLSNWDKNYYVQQHARTTQTLYNNWNLNESIFKLIDTNDEESISRLLECDNAQLKERFQSILEWVYFYRDKKAILNRNKSTIQDIESALKGNSVHSSYDAQTTQRLLDRIGNILKSAEMLFDIDFIDSLTSITFQDIDQDKRVIEECEKNMIDFNKVFLDDKYGLLVVVGRKTYQEKYIDLFHGHIKELIEVPSDPKNKQSFTEWFDKASFSLRDVALNGCQRIYKSGNSKSRLCMNPEGVLFFQAYDSVSRGIKMPEANFWADKDFVKILYVNQLQNTLTKLMREDLDQCEKKKSI